jgi:hypothetical protein
MADERQIEPSDFEGASLQQMRGWIGGGGGAEGLYDKTGGWKSEDTYLRELKTRLEGKLKEVGVVMQSKSGEALQNQAAPVVLWTEVAADSALAQSELMTAQGDAFKKVESSVPGQGEEQEVPDDSWVEESWDSMWTGSTDAEDAQAHNEKLRQEAVQAFQAYDQTSQANAQSSPVFTSPPQSGADVAVAGSTHPSVGVSQPAGTSSQSASPGGIGGGSGVGSGGIGSGGSGSPSGSSSMWQTPNPNTGGDYPQRPSYPGPGNPNGPGYPGGPGMPGRPAAGTGPGAGGGRGAGGAGGRGGIGGAGARGAGGPGMGAGGRAGVGGPGSGVPGSGPGGVGGAGGRGGMAGAGAAGGRPQGKEGEEDQEHETPDYLVGDQGVFDEDMPRVAPPVFGDWDQK